MPLRSGLNSKDARKGTQFSPTEMRDHMEETTIQMSPVNARD